MPNDGDVGQWKAVKGWLRTGARRHFIRELFPPEENIDHWSKDHKRVLSVLYRAARAIECLKKHLPLIVPLVEMVGDYLPVLAERVRVSKATVSHNTETDSVPLVHLPHNHLLMQQALTEKDCQNILGDKSTAAMAFCGPEGLSMVRSLLAPVSFGTEKEVRIDYGVDCPIPEVLSQPSTRWRYGVLSQPSTRWKKRGEQRALQREGLYPGWCWLLFCSNRRSRGLIVPDSKGQYSSSVCQSWARSTSMTNERKRQNHPSENTLTIHTRWWHPLPAPRDSVDTYAFAIHIPFPSYKEETHL